MVYMYMYVWNGLVCTFYDEVYTSCVYIHDIVYLCMHTLYIPLSLPISLPPSPLPLSPSLSPHRRVFRTMFTEGQAPSPSRRFSSPAGRRRLPTASSVISPLGNRKLSNSGAKPKLPLARRKKSAQELTRSTSPDPPAFFFCDDPRSMNIKEQVCVCMKCVCVQVYTCM